MVGAHSTALLETLPPKKRGSVRRHLEGLLTAHRITRLAAALHAAIAEDGGVEGTRSAALLKPMTSKVQESVHRQLAGWAPLQMMNAERIRKRMLEGSPLQMVNGDLVETKAFKLICSELGTHEGVKATSIDGHETSTAGREFTAELLAGAWVVRLDIAISGKKNPTRRHAFVCRKCGLTFMVRGFGR